MSLTRQIAQTVLKGNIEAKALVDVLASYNLLPLLPGIKEEITKLHMLQSKSDAIAIESPFELSREALARIKRIVGNDLAETTVSINKDIFSGFKARYKGKLYDGSGERIIKELINHK